MVQAVRASFTRNLLCGAALLAGLTPVAAPKAVSAQALEEIVVTATRREVGLQDVGVSVTAFSGETLRQYNIQTTDDITNMTPGLQLIQAGGAPLAGLIAIRGVAQNDFAAHLESANVLYIDDVYRPSNGGNLQRMYDVNRVEVLKGPQGTLFGRNATGGLIHIITQDPTEEFEGYAQVSYGEFDFIEAEGAVNIPFTETLRGRIAFLRSYTDGWLENEVGPDHFGEDLTALRGKLLFEPNDNWRVKIQAERYHNDEVEAGGGFPTGGFVGPDTLGQFRGDIPSPTDSGYVDADGSVFTGAFDFDGLFEREENVVFADVSYTYDNLTFTSITSYADLEISYAEDNDLTPVDIAIFRQNTEQDTFTQEFRVNADYERTRLTGGFYYLKIDGEYFQNYQINNLGNFNQILAPIPILLLPVGLNQAANYELETNSWSIYAQGEYDLTDQITITGGIRYTKDKKDYAYLNTCENLIPQAPACPPGGFDPTTIAGAGLIEDDHDESGVSARIQIDYRATEDWLLFASYNRGYKAFNYNAGFAGAAPLDGVRFDGETLNAYEIGSKLDFWDARARFNVSGFYYDYSDYQAFDQRGTSFVLSNSDATIYGADAELTVTPGHGLNFLFGLAYVDTEVEDIPIGGMLFDTEAPQAPELTFNVAASKTWEFQQGSIRVGMDANYTDDYFSQLNNAPVTAAGDHWLVNGQVFFTSADERWEAGVIVRNILDDERLVYAFDITFPGNGLVEQVYGPPRWVVGQVRIRF